MLMKQLIFGLLALITLSASAQPQQHQPKKQRTFTLWGHVRDGFTKAVVPGVKITLMRADSTIIDTCTAQTHEAAGRVAGDCWYSFVLPSLSQRLIIRASHPDHEDCHVDYDVRHVARNRFFDAPWHYMKRRQHEDVDFDAELGEVVVRATRVKMVYRGDTLVFDASAFKLPDGSMLDALVRQMPGVKLDDNGVITVNGRKVDCLMLNGKDFFKGDSKDKKRENITSAQATWTDKALSTATARENFLSSGTAHALADRHSADRGRSLALANDFRIRLPFWLQSNTRVELGDARNSVRSRQASFGQPASAYGEPSSVLDSVFSSSRPSGLTQALVNRTFSEAHTRGQKFHVYQNLEYNSKLPWGDNIELQAKASYTRNDSKGHQDYRLDYAQPAVPDHRLAYNHQPTRTSFLYGCGEYYLNLLNHWTYRFYSLYEWQSTRKPRDYYRLDRLAGWGAGQHPLTHLPPAAPRAWARRGLFSAPPPRAGIFKYLD